MAQSPLLGSRISLISKKNIRYEGTLYSINEANATVALQNVRSYGTEGREKTDHSCTFVAPQDSVHPYLLFRGCDIRDLHVHENQEDQGTQQAAPPEPPSTLQVDVPSLEPENAIESITKEEEIVAHEDPTVEAVEDSKQSPTTEQNEEENINGAPTLSEEKISTEKADKEDPVVSSPVKSGNNDERKPRQQGRGAGNRRSKKPPAFQVGTGASLLNRKERGGDGGTTVTPASDFDFESNLKQFNKEEESDDEAGDAPHEPSSYEKDDFFDAISCDALDRQSGVDNRLRGAAERNLNTETFGAVALNSQRRRRRYRGGRGGGRGRGRGRGGGGRGRGGRGRGRGRNGEGGRWQHGQTRAGE